MASYVCYLSHKTSSYQYILNHLNAVGLLHLFNGCSVDALDTFDVTLTNRGLKRLLGVQSRQKHPITSQILMDIRRHLDTSLPSHSALCALFCTTFFSFLRKSNLAVPAAGSFDPSRHLTHQDIKFTPSGAFLRIRWTKTLQHNEGILLIPLLSIPGSALCPVSALGNYFTLVPASPTAPLFCLPMAFGCRPINFSTFSSCLKRLISAPRSRSRQLLPSQFPSGRCHIRLSEWCTRAYDTATWGLAFRRLPCLPCSPDEDAHSGCRYYGRRHIRHKEVTEQFQISDCTFAWNLYLLLFLFFYYYYTL